MLSSYPLFYWYLWRLNLAADCGMFPYIPVADPYIPAADPYIPADCNRAEADCSWFAIFVGPNASGGPICATAGGRNVP